MAKPCRYLYRGTGRHGKECHDMNSIFVHDLLAVLAIFGAGFEGMSLDIT